MFGDGQLIRAFPLHNLFFEPCIFDLGLRYYSIRVSYTNNKEELGSIE